MSGISSLGSISNSGKQDESSMIFEDGIIREIIIGWVDLKSIPKGWYSFTRKIDFDFLGTKSILPSYLGGGKQFVHAFVIVKIGNDNYYLCEYDRIGIHIKQTNLNELMEEEEGNLMRLEIKNKKRLSEIIEKCKKEKYEGDNYSLLSKCCQTFVNVFLKELNAQRGENLYFRGCHTISMEIIPVMILEQLEKNEGDFSNAIGYIPIIGGYIDGFKLMFKSIFG